MKKFLLTLLTIFAFGMLQAQTVIWQDNFDTYQGDTLLEPQTPKWDGWYNVLTNSLVSTEKSFSGANSAKIWDGLYPGASSPSDAVGLVGELISGRYELRFKQYVPAKADSINDAGAYFNLQHDYNATAMSAQWALEVYATPPGAVNTGRLMVGGVNYFFPMKKDAWGEYIFIIDMDMDSAQMYYDSVLVHRWQWSIQANTTVAGANKFNAIDLFAACEMNQTNCVPLAYYDDFVLTQLPNPPAFTDFHLVGLPDNSRLEVVGDGTQQATFNWESAVAFSGLQTKYDLLFDVPGGDFSNPFYMTPSNRLGVDTFANVFYQALADAMTQQLGMAIGDSMDVIWSVRARDGNADMLADTSFNLKLIRGQIVGFENTELEKAIQLYPNPVQEEAFIEYQFKENKNLDIEIYNAIGQNILQKNKRNVFSGRIEISFKEFPSGVYFIKISDGKARIVKKLIVKD